MTPHLDIRTYHGEHAHHRHAFTQLVLPIQGCMEMDVEGRGACLDASTAALVAPGAVHAQMAENTSRFLILDCPPTWFEDDALRPLSQRTYLPVSSATRQLITFTELASPQVLASASAPLMQLLIASLTHGETPKASAFDCLLADIEANPIAWSNEAMSRAAGMSLSRLHMTFRHRFDTSPQAWLAEVRLRHARRWLSESSLSIADIALRVGFSDQAALTRAMHRVCDVTPAAYRRANQQPR